MGSLSTELEPILVAGLRKQQTRFAQQVAAICQPNWANHRHGGIISAIHMKILALLPQGSFIWIGIVVEEELGSLEVMLFQTR